MSSKPKMVKSRNRNGNDGAGIQPPNQDGGICLAIRTLKLEREIAEMHWPDDAKKLMEGALADRQFTFECKYRQVCRWVEMKKHGALWEDLGYRSLDELWAALDLPGGTALANWEILVRLFSKETFFLVGDDELGYMTRYVGSYQDDPNEKKRDYRAIFDTYSNENSAFEKGSFRRYVNLYVNTKYVAAEAKIDDPSKRPPRKTLKGQTERRKANGGDFKVQVDTCGGCIARDQHIALLEDVIRKGLGAKAVPKRPSFS